MWKSENDATTRALRIILVGLAFSFAPAGSLRAQSILNGTAPTDSASRAPALQEMEVTGLKSGGTALLLSLAGTALPLALSIPGFSESDGSNGGAGYALIFTFGTLVGPSLGHFYAERPGRAFAGMGVRTLCVVAVVGAVAASWDSDSAEATALGVAGVAVGGFSILYDIFSAPHSVKVHNEEVKQRAVAVGIRPLEYGPGLAICVSMAL